MNDRDKLLPFAVRILKDNPDGEPQPVGTGTLVAPRTVLTCAHVVRDALGLRQDQCEPRPTGRVRLDCVYRDNQWSGEAETIVWSPPPSAAGLGPRSARSNPPMRHDDIAVLRVTPGHLGAQQDPPESFPRWIGLNDERSFQCREMQILGFPSEHPHGHWAGGTCAGLDAYLEHPLDQPPTSIWIRGGFSGGGAWLPRHGAFAGVLRADLAREDRQDAPKRSVVISTRLVLRHFPALAIMDPTLWGDNLPEKPRVRLPILGDGGQALYELAVWLTLHDHLWTREQVLGCLDDAAIWRNQLESVAPAAECLLLIATKACDSLSGFLERLLQQTERGQEKGELERMNDSLVGQLSKAPTFPLPSGPGLHQHWDWLKRCMSSVTRHVAELLPQHARSHQAATLTIELIPDHRPVSSRLQLWAWLTTESNAPPLTPRRQPLVVDTGLDERGDEDQPDATSTAEAFARVFNEFLPHIGHIERLWIEVVLPDTLLDHGIEDWRDNEQQEIRLRYPLVLRLGDRWRLLHADLGPGPRLSQHYWEEVWERGEHGPGSVGCAALLESEEPRNFRAARNQAQTALFVLLPCPRKEKGSHPLVGALIAEGIGRAIWPCSDRLGKPETRTRLDAMLNGRPLRELPVTLKDHRGEADPDDPVGRWALLWDDPHRAPPDADLRYRDLNAAGGTQ